MHFFYERKFACHPKIINSPFTGAAKAASGVKAATLASSALLKTVGLITSVVTVVSIGTVITQRVIIKRSSLGQHQPIKNPAPVSVAIQAKFVAPASTPMQNPKAAIHGGAINEPPAFAKPAQTAERHKRSSSSTAKHPQKKIQADFPLVKSPEPSPVAAVPPSTVELSSTLSAEQGILQQAREALRQGQPDRAARAITEHRRRFPEGQLAEEREALRIRTLAQKGDLSKAKTAAAQFRARYPNSIFLPAVEEALRLKP